MNDDRPPARREDLSLAERLALPLLGPDEAAVLLRLPNKRSVMRLVRRRELPHVRIGGRVIFILSSLLDFVKRREVAGFDEETGNATVRAVAPSRRSRLG